MTDLASWNAYERLHPETFAGCTSSGVSAAELAALNFALQTGTDTVTTCGR